MGVRGELPGFSRRRPLPDFEPARGNGDSSIVGLSYDDCGIHPYVGMLCEQEHGVNLANMHAIRTWMTLDDLLDAVAMRWHQMSWEAALQRRTEPQTEPV